MRQSRVLIACVSDEYVKSDNCMMELRFGVLTLNLPLVICVVGTGREWKESEVGILMHRSKASKVYFQQENPSAHETLLTYVKKILAEKSSHKDQLQVAKQKIETKQERKLTPDKTSFNEECELTQRKFMRHIISFVSSTDSTPMPRLLVVDFDRTALVSRASKPLPLLEDAGGDKAIRPTTSRPTLRPKTASRTRERIEPITLVTEEESWEEQSFCVKLLCENEQGWHLCKTAFSVKMDEDFKPLVRRCSAYLARLYAILQQSSVQLNCFAGRLGKKYREWIEEGAMENPNFVEAYSTIRSDLRKNLEAESFLQQLCRCHLPTGKTYWLCEKHQNGPRITKLSTESASRDEVRRVLFEEDIQLRELLEKSSIYKKKRAMVSQKKSINLPPKVATSEKKSKDGAADSTKTMLHKVNSVPSIKAEKTEKPATTSNELPPTSDVKRKSSVKPTESPKTSKRGADGKSSSKTCNLQ